MAAKATEISKMDQRCFFNVHERWCKKPRTLSWWRSKPLGIVWLNASGDIALVTVIYSNDTFTVPISIPHTEKVSRTLYGKAQITRSQKLFISTMRRRVGNILKPEPKSETRLGQKCFNIWNSQSLSLKSLHPTILSHFSTHLFLFLSLLLFISSSEHHHIAWSPILKYVSLLGKKKKPIFQTSFWN